MAALRARIFAQDNSRQKEVSRLAQRDIVTHTDTWRTFVTVKLSADGSGEVVVSRKPDPNTNPNNREVVIHSYTILPE
jgi:hypothetical protein